MAKIKTVRNDPLHIDGVNYEVPWEDVDVGDSFFIPCVDTSRLTRLMNLKAKHLNWELTYDVRIEAGKWGVRFWRKL